jgi:hypothetical protein
MNKKLSPGEVHHLVRIATRQIEAAKKQAVSMYDEDIRMLRKIDLKLSTPMAVDQPELFSVDTVLTPEAQAIVEAPLAKYAQR